MPGPAVIPAAPTASSAAPFAATAVCSGPTTAGVPDDPRWFLDPRRCRDLATRFRRAGCDGLIAPSVAFLDDPARWNAVVFVDRVPSLDIAVQGPRPSVEIGYRA